MADATTAPNPQLPNFFSDLADQAIAKLDIGTGRRVIALIEQVVIENQGKLTQLQADSKRNKAEIKACNSEVTALNDVIGVLQQHQNRLGPCKNRHDLVNCMIGCAKQRVKENESRRKRLAAESPKNEQAIKACQWEIATLGQLIRALIQFSKELDPYEDKEDENWKGLVKDIIDWAKKGVRDSNKKLGKFQAASWKSGQEISAGEGNILVLTESIQALEKCQNDLVAHLDRYVQDQDKNPQDFVTLLTRALDGNREAAKHVRRVTIPEPRQVLVSNKALAKKVSVRLQAELVDKSDQIQKTLSKLFPNSNVSMALDAYVTARSKLKQKLADEFQKCLGFALRIWRSMEWPLPFGLVLGEELTELDGLRTKRHEEAHGHTFKKLEPNRDSPFDAAVKGELVGLAFSGGGIRSATFNLGVLQGLARSGLLRFFDYLSTVSGGGYIGAWLLAWLKRKGFGNVSRQLPPQGNKHDGQEPPEIEFLRSYSNYLTPQPGLLSADTWSFVATWARNLLLNLTILVLVISALLLLPRLVVSLSHSGHPFIYLIFTAVLMLIAISFNGANLKLFSCRHKEYPRYSEQMAIQWAIVIPTVLASWLGSCWLWNEGRKLVCYPYAWVFWMLSVAVLTSIVWFVASLFSSEKNHVEDSDQSTEPAKPLVWLPLVLFSFLEGAVGGLLFFGLACLYNHWCRAAYPGNNVHFVAWGTGLVAGVFGIMVAIQIGLMGKRFPDERREWWSRTGAFISIYSLAWTALFALALYSPLLILWSGPWLGSAATLGWLAHTIYGALGAQSAKTGGSGPTDGTGFLIKAAPSVFVVGLLALLSFFIYWVSPLENPRAHHEAVAVTMNLDMRQDFPGKSATVSASVNSASASDKLSYPDLAQAYWRSSVRTDGRTGLWIFVIALLCVSLALFLSWRVDINEFSMHLLYRNRVVRCYLGASHQGEKHERNPNPFTGFDPDDDILLAEFAHSKPGEENYVGPYPILNTTLNVTHGKRLAWQERKAESFVFTPRYCGYDVKPDWQPRVDSKTKPFEDAGYRPTEDYLYSEKSCPGGPNLGTAVGISGAALSPNMGYHSNSALAFLMTVFNVRLGWWAGNTRHQGGRWTGNPRYRLSRRTTDPPWKRRGPGLGILYLLLELFGLTDDERGYVYLSDGGHFENLGVYELVRRGCRLIVVSDASEDENYQFEDLGSAIRKCRIDFGVEITDLQVENLRPKANKDDDTKWSQGHCAVGIIHYEKLDASKKPGLLVYLKASLTGHEPTDVLEYKSKHPAFPHDSTANQFFTESQFESYRKLGEHIIGKCLEKEVLDLKVVGANLQPVTVLRVIQEPELWMDRSVKDLDEGLRSAVQRYEQAKAEPKPGSANQSARPAESAAGESGAPAPS